MNEVSTIRLLFIFYRYLRKDIVYIDYLVNIKNENAKRFFYTKNLNNSIKTFLIILLYVYFL